MTDNVRLATYGFKLREDNACELMSVTQRAQIQLTLRHKWDNLVRQQSNSNSKAKERNSKAIAKQQQQIAYVNTSVNSPKPDSAPIIIKKTKKNE